MQVHCVEILSKEKYKILLLNVFEGFFIYTLK